MYITYGLAVSCTMYGSGTPLLEAVMRPILISTYALGTLVLILAIGSVVVRLAAHAKREGWDRLTAAQLHLRSREQRIVAAVDRCTCGASAMYLHNEFGR